MKPPQPRTIVFWIVAIVAPFIITAVGLAQLPGWITEIPMQVGFDGVVTRTGPPSELWVLSFIMAGCNIILAVSFFGNDFLYAQGLVHGVSKAGALKLYVALAAFMVALQIGCIVFLISQAM